MNYVFIVENPVMAGDFVFIKYTYVSNHLLAR